MPCGVSVRFSNPATRIVLVGVTTALVDLLRGKKALVDSRQTLLAEEAQRYFGD